MSIILSNADLTVEISALGAEMQRITTAQGDELLWDGQEAFWTGRAPLLFPIVGKAPDDLVSVNGQEGAMKQHGFARRSMFDLVFHDSDEALFRLTDTADSRAVYPCSFQLDAHYQISGACLKNSVTVRNTGDRVMPFGMGFHPAFVWPLPGAQGRPHTIALKGGGAPDLCRLEGGLFSAQAHPSPFAGGQMTLDHSQFEEDAMIFPRGASEGLRYSAEGARYALDFAFTNTPNLGIWSKPDAPFVCIEPWHGMAAYQGAGNDIAYRPDSVLLQPGEAIDFAYEVTVQPEA